MDQGPLVWSPANYNAYIRDRVLKEGGERGLTPREKKWYRVMMERNRAARKGYLQFSNYYTLNRPPRLTSSESSVASVDPEEESRRALNQRLRNTLRRVRSAEKKQNRPTMRRRWQNLANISLEYRRQGRRYSEKLRNLKAELQREEEAAAAPRVVMPIPLKKPMPPSYFISRAQAPPQYEAPAPSTRPSWTRLPPLENISSEDATMEGGRRRRRRTHKK
jgi:hypothetical protein